MRLIRLAASRAIDIVDDHPYVGVAAVAFTARLAFVLATFWRSGYVAPDEQQYVELARTVAAGHPASAWHPTYGQFLYTTTWPFTGVLRFLFAVLGPSRFVAQLYPALAGTAVAVLTVVFARRLVTRRCAVLAGLIVALMPSQILWSSIALREAFVWLALVALGVLGLLAAERGLRALPAVLALVVIVVLTLEHLRNQTLIAALWALMVSAWFGSRHRLARGASVLAVGVIVPVLLGLGVAGIGYVRYGASGINERRALLGAGAESSVTGNESSPIPQSGLDAANREAPSGKNPQAARRAPIAVRPDGRRVVTDGSGNTYAVEDSGGATLRHVPQGLLAFLVRPYPWEATHKIGITLARIENLTWFALYALAAWGVVLSRRRPEIVYPVLLVALVVGINAVSQGNLGTAFRHRGQILWAVAVLAVVPVEGWWTRRRGLQPAGGAR